MHGNGNGTDAKIISIYLSRKSLPRPEMHAFLKLYKENAAVIVPQIGYVPVLELVAGIPNGLCSYFSLTFATALLKFIFPSNGSFNLHRPAL